MANIEKVTHMLDEVNPLVKEAFGKRCKGNFLNISSDMIETDRLEVIIDRGIGHPLWGYLPFFFPKAIGKFDSKDGSSIRVMPEYREQAKRYAESYKEKFEKEVTIIIDNQANMLNSLGGFG